VSLRWRIALGYALVALATAAVIALAAPPIVNQGFSDYDRDGDAGQVVATAAPTQPGASEIGDGSVQATTAPSAPAGAGAPGSTNPGPPNNGQAPQTTIIRLILAAIAAAAVASLFGLLGAGRLVRPLSRLEQAAGAVAGGDLGRRSGLADRSDEF
jgi:methyl-accepting chemotaxis protein